MRRLACLIGPAPERGRDAVGYLRVGSAADPLELDFAPEAKRCAMNLGVGVKEVARQAELAVAAAKYHPDAKRGVYPSLRGAGYDAEVILTTTVGLTPRRL